MEWRNFVYQGAPRQGLPLENCLGREASLVHVSLDERDIIRSKGVRWIV